MKKKYVVSVDLGGTKILAALIDANAKIGAREKVATDSERGKNAVVKSIGGAIEKVIAESKVNKNEIEAVAMGVPGAVDPFSGKIAMAPNLGFNNYNIRTALSKFTDFPVLIENDVNLAALGIQKFELSEKNKNVLVVFVGTGIGGALILNGEIYRGSNFYAGEIGHTLVKDNGAKCGCGKKGCLEAEAGRLAIVRNIKARLKAGEKSLIQEILPKNKPIKSKSIAASIKKKDKVVSEEVVKACEHIGKVTANIANLLNLDTIVFGGGVVEAVGDFMLPKIKASFEKAALKEVSKNIKIISTKLGDDAALLGGIALAEEMLER